MPAYKVYSFEPRGKVLKIPFAQSFRLLMCLASLEARYEAVVSKRYTKHLNFRVRHQFHGSSSATATGSIAVGVCQDHWHLEGLGVSPKFSNIAPSTSDRSTQVLVDVAHDA